MIAFQNNTTCKGSECVSNPMRDASLRNCWHNHHWWWSSHEGWVPRVPRISKDDANYYKLLADIFQKANTRHSKPSPKSSSKSWREIATAKHPPFQIIYRSLLSYLGNELSAHFISGFLGLLLSSFHPNLDILSLADRNLVRVSWLDPRRPTRKLQDDLFIQGLRFVSLNLEYLRDQYQRKGGIKTWGKGTRERRFPLAHSATIISISTNNDVVVVVIVVIIIIEKMSRWKWR